MSETSTYMTKEDILDTIQSLSHSQGLYSRLYEHLRDLEENDPEQFEWFMNHLQQQHFKDPVDLVLFFEC